MTTEKRWAASMRASESRMRFGGTLRDSNPRPRPCEGDQDERATGRLTCAFTTQHYPYTVLNL